MTGKEKIALEVGGEHPAADELAGFAEGTLPFADEQQVRRHLKLCGECRDLIRDLSSYPDLEPPSEAHQVDNEELRTTLGALRARILDSSPSQRTSRSEASRVAPRPETQGRRHEPIAPAPVAERPATPADRSPRSVETAQDRRRWWPLLAAAVVLLALGWGWQRGTENTDLRNRLATAEGELRRPWVNVKVARLLAGEDPLRGSPTTNLVLGRTGSVVLIQTPEPLPAGRYTGEIRKPDDEVVLRIEDLEPQTIGLSFSLPSAALEPGEYRLWLLQGSAEIYPTPFELRVSE